jgi:short-subunit dehydrogenase
MKKEPKTTWSIGATSKIAIEMARVWAKDNNFVLASRNKSDLKTISKDLIVRGAKKVEVFSLPELMGQRAQVSLGMPMDRLLIALGSLSNQKNWQDQKQYRDQEWQVNTSDVIDWIEWGASQIETTNRGQICVMTSVAADRAKRSNYAYGAAKAALDFYLEGVAHRLSKIQGNRKYNQITILKPGPTRTPMTSDMFGKKKLADPKSVAISFCKAIDKEKYVVYAPFQWKFIMLIIKYLPKRIWFKTDL